MGKIPLKSLRLEIAICTFGNERLASLASHLPPSLPGIVISIHLQIPDPATEPAIPPAISSRDDITVHLHRTAGVAQNRNHAIESSMAPITMITDDDITFIPENLAAIPDDFDSHPDAEIISYRYDSDRKKHYPDATVAITEKSIPKNFHFSAPELTFRTANVRGKVTFNEHFGFGTTFIGGEDDVFFADALKAGIGWFYIPRSIGFHPGDSTGSRADSGYAHVETKAAVILHQHTLTWPLRMMVHCKRETRPGNRWGYTSALKYLRHWIRGVMKARRFRVFRH